MCYGQRADCADLNPCRALGPTSNSHTFATSPSFGDRDTLVDGLMAGPSEASYRPIVQSRVQTSLQRINASNKSDAD